MVVLLSVFLYQKEIYIILVNLYRFFYEFDDLSKQERYQKLSYFSDIFNVFSDLRENYPFVFPKVLFENPNSKPSTIVVPSYVKQDGRNRISEDISIILNHLLPGMWNYRYGYLTKSQSNGIIQEEINYVNLSRLQDCDFELIGYVKTQELPDGYPLVFLSDLLTN